MSLGKGLESLIPPQNQGSNQSSSNEGSNPTTSSNDQFEASTASSSSASTEHRSPEQEQSQRTEQDHNPSPSAPARPAVESPPKTANIFYIEVEKITPNPQQPRREFNEEELTSLANSIRQYGVLQPLVVTKKEIEVPHGRRVEYELLAGERRLRASKLAGFSQVPVIIKEADDQQKLELALIENVQREDLNPIEEAQAYKKLADEFSLTQEEVADKVGKSRETVANKLRLLALPKDVQQYISDELIAEGHGKVLLSVGSPERQRMLAKETIKNGWSVRRLERQIKRGERKKRESNEPDPQLQRYKQIVEEHLGTTVSISGKPEKGRLAINFHSPDDLERLVARLAGLSAEAEQQDTDVKSQPQEEQQTYTTPEQSQQQSTETGEVPQSSAPQSEEPESFTV